MAPLNFVFIISCNTWFCFACWLSFREMENQTLCPLNWLFSLSAENQARRRVSDVNSGARCGLQTQLCPRGLEQVRSTLRA